ncbi:MAG: NAD(P)-binding protein [Desulfobacterales bacterium]|nr:NAD(P)-binding protein [Desulfobacterales bacterium]
MGNKNVLIIGGGTAGLSAAGELSNLDIHVDLVEKSDFLGGHAIGYTCKATRNTCVKCGACMVEEKLKDTILHPKIKMWAGSRVQEVSKNSRFTAKIHCKPKYIDPDKCTNCRICFDKCPVDDAILHGSSKNNIPFYAVNEEKCLYFKDKSCGICRDECPEKAIDLDKEELEHSIEADAVLVAAGFHPFNPEDKPYGYNRFDNVVTSLDLERMLKQVGRVKRPSDDTIPERIAFIQCVGSRDSKLNHLWCSKVCCGSAMRMARLIKDRHPEIDITVFYIDVQTFGKNFEQFYKDAQEELEMIRAIPGDIYEVEEQKLKINFLNNTTHETLEEIFDLVVLSIGITPGKDNGEIAELLHLKLADSGFIESGAEETSAANTGIFTAGTISGAMSIPETIASAGKAVRQIVKHLRPNSS